MAVAKLHSHNGFQLAISDESADSFYALVKLSSVIGNTAKNIYELELRELVAELRQLHETMTGEANIESLEGDFIAKFSAKPLGHIQIDAEISEPDGPSLFRSTGNIDQSYLPTFITNLKKLDLSGDRGDS